VATDDNSNKTRQNIQQDPLNPKPHLNSGYEGAPSLDFTIPPCGIRDIDEAMVRLFRDDIGFRVNNIVTQIGPKNISKPQVIFATGERFALIKKLSPPRDKGKTLILPAISIRRMSISQTSDDVAGRGMNQFTGNLVIKRLLSPEDRDYQNLVNKQGLQNMQGILNGLPTTTRETGSDKSEVEVVQGGLLEPTLDNNNIYEIISIPQPQFFTAKYEVVFWTGWTQHMVYMMETFMSSFLPQGRMHKLKTDKGYWFIAKTEDTFENGENVDDFTEDERVLRYTLNISVRGYLLAPQHPTNMVPVRRWLSSPNIVFDMHSAPSEVQPEDHLAKPPIGHSGESRFVLTDLEKDPKKTQTKTSLQKFLVKKTVFNPITGKRKVKYVSILGGEQAKGETVYRASDIETLEQFILSPNKK